MLKLIQSIFGAGKEHGRYPESLIEMAIQRAVDATNPLARAVRGYRKQLRAPVIHSLDHASVLVDAIPAPLSAEYRSFHADPRLTTLFASPEHMLEVFGDDFSIREFLRGSRAAANV